MFGRGGEWIRGFGLGFTNHVETRGVLDVCLFLVAVVLVMQVGNGWRGGVVLSLCEL